MPHAEQRSAPIKACRWEAGLQFAAKGDATEGRPPPQRVTILARTPDPLDHWYWGPNTIHDFEGFQQDRPTVVLDYCHNDDEIVGHADKFDATDAGLSLSALLIPNAPRDRADEIIYRRSQGTEYEASIYFDPRVVEQVLAGQTAVVNGQTVIGPACIFRKWGLKAVAVCPHGYDDGTTIADAETELAAPEVHPLKFSLTPTTGTPTMTTPAPAAVTNPPADAEQLAAPVAQPMNDRAAAKAELAKFTQHFGAEAAAAYFGKETKFEDALLEQFTQQKTGHATALAAKDTEIADLKTKLGLVDRGESKPAQFQDRDAPEKGAPAAAPVNAVQKFALSLKGKLPGRKSA